MKPKLVDDTLDKIKRILMGDGPLTRGPYRIKLEQALAKKYGTKYCAVGHGWICVPTDDINEYLDACGIFNRGLEETAEDMVFTRIGHNLRVSEIEAVVDLAVLEEERDEK